MIEAPELHTNIRPMVMDCDAVSSYPSDSIAINISKDTMSKEILDIEGVEPIIGKLQNINLMFGKINSIEYCNRMFNFPKLHQLTGNLKGKFIPDLDNNIPLDLFKNGGEEDEDEKEDEDD